MLIGCLILSTFQALLMQDKMRDANIPVCFGKRLSFLTVVLIGIHCVLICFAIQIGAYFMSIGGIIRYYPESKKPVIVVGVFCALLALFFWGRLISSWITLPKSKSCNQVDVIALRVVKGIAICLMLPAIIFIIALGPSMPESVMVLEILGLPTAVILLIWMKFLEHLIQTGKRGKINWILRIGLVYCLIYIVLGRMFPIGYFVAAVCSMVWLGLKSVSDCVWESLNLSSSDPEEKALLVK